MFSPSITVSLEPTILMDLSIVILVFLEPEYTPSLKCISVPFSDISTAFPIDFTGTPSMFASSPFTVSTSITLGLSASKVSFSFALTAESKIKPAKARINITNTLLFKFTLLPLKQKFINYVLIYVIGNYIKISKKRSF